MDVKSAIIKRRSIRKYKPWPIPWQKLLEIADSARYSPSVGDLQNFSIVIVVDSEMIEKIANLAKQYWISTARAIMVVCIEYNVEYSKETVDHEVGAIVENMLLRATDLGIGSCWVESFDRSQLKEAIKAKKEPVAFVTLGYADEKPEKKLLKNIDEMIFYNTFGTKVFSIYEKIQSPRILERQEKIGKKIKSKIQKLFKRKLNKD